MDAGIFSPSSKRLYKLAQNEASLLGHDYISTEHLLLAIFASNPVLSSRLLTDLSIGEDDLRNQINQIVQIGTIPFTPPKKFPMTLQAKRAVEISMSEAGIGEQGIVEPEHLLIGMVVEPDNEPTVVTQAFKNCGASLDTLLTLTRQYAKNINSEGNADSAR